MNSHALPEVSGGQAVSLRDGAAVRFCSVSAVRPILSRLRHFLTGEETARLGTYRQDPDRERFLLGRALLRLFVGDILGVHPINRIDELLPWAWKAAHPSDQHVG